MSTQIKREEKKWIQSSVAILCMVVSYILILFFDQIGEWFELESKIPYFSAGTRVISVGVALATFFTIMINQKSSTYLKDVFLEAVKVVWPDKNETVKHTFSIVILVTIIGFALFLFDLLANYLLTQIR